MSEEQRITKVEKEKDPRRVEAGKRLGAISRAAKEKKMMERMQADDRADSTNNTETSYMSVIAGVGVLTGLVCLYFTYRQDRRATRTEAEPKPREHVTNYTAWTTEHHRIRYNKEKYVY